MSKSPTFEGYTLDRYDGRVPTNKRWWQFWKPEYDPDKWVCEYCGGVYVPWNGAGVLHEMEVCVSEPDYLVRWRSDYEARWNEDAPI